MAEEIIFCAKTGHRIVDDNVVPFPRRGPKPVPFEDEAKPVPVDVEPAPENDDI
ncbi:hypothetical protein NKI54_09930 [Mesorhizobium sp. M0663]|uniref:hypothetical protein n=1 Tax=unclassified Mesorhizobium TaxID=325217 RepID=UPI00333C09E1